MLELQAEVAGSDNAGGYGPLDVLEFMLGLIDGKPVACGALRQVAPGVGEINRMYVRPSWRGEGLSWLILAALEERAVELGFHLLRLETVLGRGRATRLYEGAGFHAVAGHLEGADDPRRACYEKSLLSVLAATPAEPPAVSV